MNEFKYQITQLVFLVLLGLGGYWALTHLDSGITYSRDQIINPNEELPVADNQVNTVDNETVIVAGENPTLDTPISDDEPLETPTSSDYQALLEDLQDLIDANITLDSGSTGSRVGTVQEFLDIYFDDRDVTIDNDFGPTTKGLVREFQTEELNGGDGRVGPNTLGAMVSYLER